MNETESDSILDRIRDKHILIENLLQQIGKRVSQTGCASCAKVCCEEVICRETVDSDFLRYILRDKIKEYDKREGWFRQGKGCSLTYGRPFVCYEYFCSKFNGTNGVVELQHLAKLFRQCYSRELGSRHILAVDDIQKIAVNKLARILGNLEQFYSLANEALQGASHNCITALPNEIGVATGNEGGA